MMNVFTLKVWDVAIHVRGRAAVFFHMPSAGDKAAWTEVGASEPFYRPDGPVYPGGAIIIVRVSLCRAYSVFVTQAAV